MSVASWIEKPTALVADLKRKASEVRRAVEALPVTQDPITGEIIDPRKRRLCNVSYGSRPEFVEPSLNPGALDPQRYRKRSR